MRIKIKIENEIIKGFLFVKQEKPKLIKIGCNFDEKTDFKNSVEIEVASFDDIKVDETKFIEGQLINK